MRRSSITSLSGTFFLCLLTVAACDGPQSTLAPAGRDAERIATLFFWMAGGAVLIWLGVIGLAVHASLTTRTLQPARVRLMVIGGGTVFPIVVLGVLLVGGLAQMPALLDPGPEGGPRIVVSAEQFWWRVTYETEDGRVIPTANVLALPVDERTEIEVVSPDVIHSFWVPRLAGKVDAIPGRRNNLALEPLQAGTYRGVCAEFCGPSHAHMELRALVLQPEAFEAWLDHQAAEASPRAAGLDLFLASGCGACHTVRGTAATGTIGPDLTHVGSRPILAGGLVDNDVGGFRHWLEDTKRLKPDVHMPAFGMLPDDELDRLAVFLEGLQ